MAFKSRRYHGDDALLDGGETDVLLIGQQEPVVGLQNNLPAPRTHPRVLLFNETEERVKTRIRGLEIGTVLGRRLCVELVHLLQSLARALQGLQDTATIK